MFVSHNQLQWNIIAGDQNIETIVRVRQNNSIVNIYLRGQPTTEASKDMSLTPIGGRAQEQILAVEGETRKAEERGQLGKRWHYRALTRMPWQPTQQSLWSCMPVAPNRNESYSSITGELPKKLRPTKLPAIQAHVLASPWDPPDREGELSSWRRAMTVVVQDCYRQGHPCWIGLLWKHTKRFPQRAEPGFN